MIAELGELGAEEEGGKAAGLARLRAIGPPVPPALVVPVSAGGVLERRRPRTSPPGWVSSSRHAPTRSPRCFTACVPSSLQPPTPRRCSS
jgi:hypothetical protein